MNRKWIRWAVGIGIGISIGAAIFMFAYYPTHFSQRAKIARKLHADPAAYIAVCEIGDRADKHLPVSDADIERLRELAKDPSAFVRDHAMADCSEMSYSPQATVATEIIRSGLNDPFWAVRSAAISGMHRIHAPDAADAARKLQQDPSSTVRESAERILMLEGAKG